MKSEPSRILRVKLVTNNIVLGSLGIQHCLCSVLSLFEETCKFETLDKKCSFPLRISSVNVSKSAVSCGFVRFTDKIVNGKLYFLCNDKSGCYFACILELILHKQQRFFMSITMHKKCPNTDFFLVSLFPYLDTFHTAVIPLER